MWIDMILLSFIVALLRGGRLKEFPVFNRLWLLGVSVLFQIGSYFTHSGIGNILVSVGYGFTIIFFYFNREMEDFRVLIIGWLLNALPIWTNFGRMPVDIDQAKKAPFDVSGLINGTDWKHVMITKDTHFAFLSDVFFVPFPIPRVISIGDIFIAFGVFLLIQRLMNKPISLLKLREGNYNGAKI